MRSAQELLAQGLRTYGLDESRSELLLRFAEALLYFI